MADIEHAIARRKSGRNHRWECSCGWHTPWTFYTRPQDAPDALRHSLGIVPADRESPAQARLREWREHRDKAQAGSILISREFPESDSKGADL